MAKSNQKKIDSFNKNKKKDILGIVLLAFSIILISAFILEGEKKYVGSIGLILSGSLKEFLGYICYLIPIVLLWWAITEFRHKKFPLKYSMMAGLLLITLGGSIFLHILFREKGGGILGDFTSDVIIQSAFGRIGAYIISIALILVSIILMADVSIKKTVFFLINSFKKAIQKWRKKKIKITKSHVTEVPPKPGEEKPAVSIKKKREKKLKAPVSLQSLQEVKKPETEPVLSANYNIPVELLNNPGEIQIKAKDEEERGKKLKDVLHNFDIDAEISGIQVGPAITRYEVALPPGIKLSLVRNLSSNIAMALEAKTVRLLTPIPGKSAVGVEVPAIQQETVYLKTIINSIEYKSQKTEIPYCLGKSVDGDLRVVDIAAMPHVLFAGATGSGKSVAIHGLITSILFKSSPEEVRFLMIDPKRVELPIYNGIPHLVSEVITSPKKAVQMLQAVTREMDERYNILAEINEANITAYNKRALEKKSDIMPRLVVIIDELADLMALSKEKVEKTIVRIAQMARAVGIHLILATQRPSVDIITGIIKANLPTRIAFNVLSGVDSRTILDTNGAEKLIGKGDMLYLSSELQQPERLQGCFISREETARIVKHLKNMDFKNNIDLKLEEKLERTSGASQYKDDLYHEAVGMVIRKQKASISLLQRRLHIGYTRAARIIDAMEDNGIIGDENGVKGREVLVSKDRIEK